MEQNTIRLLQQKLDKIDKYKESLEKILNTEDKSKKIEIWFACEDIMPTGWTFCKKNGKYKVNSINVFQLKSVRALLEKNKKCSGIILYRNVMPWKNIEYVKDVAFIRNDSKAHKMLKNPTNEGYIFENYPLGKTLSITENDFTRVINVNDKIAIKM